MGVKLSMDSLTLDKPVGGGPKAKKLSLFRPLFFIFWRPFEGANPCTGTERTSYRFSGESPHSLKRPHPSDNLIPSPPPNSYFSFRHGINRQTIWIKQFGLQKGRED